MPSVSRRAVTGAVLSLAAVAATSTAQAAPEAGADSFAAGPIPVDPGRSGIVSLVLPAVQGASLPAQLVLLDGYGQEVFRTEIPLSESGATARTYDLFEPQYVPGEGGPPAYLHAGVRCRETGALHTFSNPTRTLCALLLPAVQRAGKTIPPIAASLQGAPATRETEQPNPRSPLLIPIPGMPDLLLPLLSPVGGDALAFGPATLGDGESLALSLLLPNVSGAETPARIEIFDAAGGLLLRETPGRGTSYEVAFGDGSVRVVRQIAGGDGVVVAVAAGNGTVGATLLPAVQRGGKTVAGIAGAIRTPGAFAPAAIVPCV